MWRGGVEGYDTVARSFVGRGVFRDFLGCLISSAGYHFAAFAEGVGMVRDPPFLAPPICFVVWVAADMVGRRTGD